MNKKIMQIIGSVGILSLLVSAAMGGEEKKCDTPTSAQIAKLFDQWNASLQTLDPSKVVANYDKDAVLLPTLSNQMRDEPVEIRDYFVHFLQKNPVGRIDSRDIRVGCNLAVDTGLYTFTLQDKEGKKQDVAARYTFVYGKSNDKWLIVSHHSSAMPEPVKVK